MNGGDHKRASIITDVRLGARRPSGAIRLAQFLLFLAAGWGQQRRSSACATTACTNGTRGFAAPEDAGTAVCVLPGTELAFAENPGGLFGLRVSVVNHTTAIFRQVNKDEPRAHHDALEFPDGEIVLLTELVEGQQATVLQLPAQPATAAEAKAQERVAHIG